MSGHHRPTPRALKKMGLAALVLLHTLAIHGCDAVPTRSNDAAEANPHLQDQTLLALDCAHRSADVARSAAEICGSLPVEEALRTVGIMPNERTTPSGAVPSVFH